MIHRLTIIHADCDAEAYYATEFWMLQQILSDMEPDCSCLIYFDETPSLPAPYIDESTGELVTPILYC